MWILHIDELNLAQKVSKKLLHSIVTWSKIPCKSINFGLFRVYQAQEASKVYHVIYILKLFEIRSIMQVKKIAMKRFKLSAFAIDIIPT